MSRTLLLAPVLALAGSTASADISISNKPTQNMSCSGGVCIPTAQNAVLNVGDLTSMLAAGDLAVQSGNGDGTAAAITIANGFDWTNTSRLTLTAKKNITVKAPVTVAGIGALTLNYNQGNVDGDLLFQKGGKINFSTPDSKLVIQGQSYTLVMNIAELAAHTSGYVALAADYDAGSDGTYSAPPINDFGGGVLEGLGHAISNVSINNKKEICVVGLIGSVSPNGVVRDIGVLRAKVVAERGYYYCGYLNGGILIGVNGGILQNSYATGDVKGGNATFLGGLVGRNDSTIVSSFAHARTTSDSYGTVNGYIGNGGLVGLNNFTGVVLNSHAKAVVDGLHLEYVGGLVGLNWGTISRSSSEGRVSASQGLSVGGLVGLNGGAVLYSQSSARVDAHDAPPSTGAFAGGLVGNNGVTNEGLPEIEESFSIGTVTGGQNLLLGGLVGQNDGTILNAYSTSKVKVREGAYGTVGGLVSGNGGYGYGGKDGGAIKKSYAIGLLSPSGGGYRGGFVAYDVAQKLGHDYWDLDTTGVTDPNHGAGNIPNDPGITGLSDAQLRSRLPKGFDPGIWASDPKINNGYPYLRANPPQ